MSSTPSDACLCNSRQGQATCSSAELSESAWITQLEALRGQEHQHSCALQVGKLCWLLLLLLSALWLSCHLAVCTLLRKGRILLVTVTRPPLLAVTCCNGCMCRWLWRAHRQQDLPVPEHTCTHT